MFFILGKHHTQKEILEFKNLIQNPSQIPILKESSNYNDFAKNISKQSDCENREKYFTDQDRYCQ